MEPPLLENSLPLALGTNISEPSSPARGSPAIRAQIPEEQRGLRDHRGLLSCWNKPNAPQICAGYVACICLTQKNAGFLLELFPFLFFFNKGCWSWPKIRRWIKFNQQACKMVEKERGWYQLSNLLSASEREFNRNNFFKNKASLGYSEEELLPQN